MRKILTFLLLFAFCTVMVQGWAYSNKVSSVQKVRLPTTQKQAASLRCAKAKVDINKRVLTEIKVVCKKESKSVLSKIFNFELPTLPFEDFLLAAQKALLDKLL